MFVNACSHMGIRLQQYMYSKCTCARLQENVHCALVVWGVSIIILAEQSVVIDTCITQLLIVRYPSVHAYICHACMYSTYII